MLEKLIHNADGSLVFDDPYQIGKRVRRVGVRGRIPIGALGTIESTNDNLYHSDNKHVYVIWETKHGTDPAWTLRTAIEILD